MIRYCWFGLLFLQASVFASERINVNLNEVRFVDFVRLVYSELSPRSFVLSPELVNNKELITVNLKEVTSDSAEYEVFRLGKALGFSINELAGVVRISKAVEEQEHREAVVYRPKHRSVSYLLDLVAGVFPKDSFSGYRGVSNPSNVLPVVQSGAGSGPSQGAQRQSNSRSGQSPGSGQMQPVETASNAFGQIAKNDQDVIIFNGSEKDRKKLFSLFEQIDCPSMELLVKAAVYEVRKVESEGSALTLAASILGGKLGISIDGGALPGNALKVKLTNFDAVYSALSSDKRFKLVSAPVIRMRSGTTAKFIAGSDVPVLGNISYQNGVAIQAVDYKSSGVILDLQATARDDSTDLRIAQQISSFIPTSTGANQSPTLLKRELLTNVTSKPEDLIMLGGLDESQDSGDDTGFSFLPAFMRSSGSTKQSTEIMVLLNVQRI
jgi:type II secretory pathway component GspD/PulD (secretin)